MGVTLPFQSFTPDLPALNNPGSTKLHNVLPGRGAQGITVFPIRRASLFSNTSMTGRPLGSAIGQDGSGNFKVYSGDSGKLYKLLPATKQWQDISRAGGYTTAPLERWKSVEFGKLQIFTNYTNEPQWISMDSDVQFANLTTLVKGRHIATFSGFTILANTYDAFDGAVPYRIRWSALENPSDWNFSASTMADFQDIAGAGACNGIVTDDNCYLLMQRSIYQMQFIGAPLVFQFQQRVPGLGCSVPESVISVAGRHFWIADDGFVMMQAGQITRPGNGRIDKWFADRFDATQAHRMTVTSDPKQCVITWQWCSEDAEPGKPDMCLHYNYESNEWSTSAATTTYRFNSVSLPWTLDMLDSFGSIDNVSSSFDSPIWSGGTAMTWGMSETGAIYSFGGPNLVAEIESPEYQASTLVSQDGRVDIAQIRAIRPIFEGSAAVGRVQVGTKNLPTDDVEWSPMSETSAVDGYAYLRSKSRYQRFRLTISGDWDRASAIEIDARAAGRR